MPTRPEPAPLRPITLGDNGAVELEISGQPQPLTELRINGVGLTPSSVLAPMTVQRDEVGRVVVALRVLVDEIELTTADDKTWRLDADGNLTTKENTHA